MNKTVNASVDRREGSFFVCIGDAEGEEYLVPLTAAPMKEGDLVRLTFQDGALLSVLVDEEETAKRKAANKSRLRALFNKNK